METIYISLLTTMDESLSTHPYDKETHLTSTAREGIDRLAAELAAGDTSLLEGVLSVMARFPRRSLMNQLLIAQQAPGATDLRTFEEWGEAGYAVAQGQRGIRILQQRSWTRPNPETTEEETVQSIVSVPVFDVTQINPAQRADHPVLDPLEHVRDLVANPVALGAQLEQAIVRDGMTVTESEQSEAKQRSNTIVIRPGTNEAQRCVDLLYGYAQQFLRYDQARTPQPQAIREQEAAIVTSVVAGRYGLAVTVPTETLRALDTSPAELLAQFDTMRSAISRLVRRIEADPDEVPRATHDHRTGDE